MVGSSQIGIIISNKANKNNAFISLHIANFLEFCIPNIPHWLYIYAAALPLSYA